MAYRDPKLITCPNCAVSDTVVWIVGVPLRKQPDTQKGKTYSVKPSDVFAIETTQKRPTWDGTITCNACGTRVRDSQSENQAV